jgi:hypothetical protein
MLPGAHRFLPEGTKIRVNLSCTNRSADLGDERFRSRYPRVVQTALNAVARKLAANRAVLALTDYLERHGTPRRIEDLREHDCVLFPRLRPRESGHCAEQAETASSTGRERSATNEMDVGDGPSPPAWESVSRRRMVGTPCSGAAVPVLRQYWVLPQSAIYLVYLPNRTPHRGCAR